MAGSPLTEIGAPPAGAMPCSPAGGRSLFLFEGSPPSSSAGCAAAGRVEGFDPGPFTREGDPATCFYVLLEGAVG